MLEFTLAKGEKITLGSIEVVVKDIQPYRVKLIVYAPRHIPVNRKEVHERIMKENK